MKLVKKINVFRCDWIFCLKKPSPSRPNDWKKLCSLTVKKIFIILYEVWKVLNTDVFFILEKPGTNGTICHTHDSHHQPLIFARNQKICQCSTTSTIIIHHGWKRPKSTRREPTFVYANGRFIKQRHLWSDNQKMPDPKGIKRFLIKVRFGPPNYTKSASMIGIIQAFRRNIPYGENWRFSADSPKPDGTVVLQYSCGGGQAEEINRQLVTLLACAPRAFNSIDVIPFIFDGTNDPVHNNDPSVDSTAFPHQFK